MRVYGQHGLRPRRDIIKQILVLEHFDVVERNLNLQN